jgi:hypothetical protein
MSKSFPVFFSVSVLFALSSVVISSVAAGFSADDDLAQAEKIAQKSNSMKDITILPVRKHNSPHFGIIILAY